MLHGRPARHTYGESSKAGDITSHSGAHPELVTSVMKLETSANALHNLGQG